MTMSIMRAVRRLIPSAWQEPWIEPTVSEFTRWEETCGPLRRRIIFVNVGGALAVYAAAQLISLLISPSSVWWDWFFDPVSIVLVAFVGGMFALPALSNKRKERIRAWRLMTAMQGEFADADGEKPVVGSPPLRNGWETQGRVGGRRSVEGEPKG